jgi:dTDP-4-amino-4,6-dideoxygalactose transaminase
MKIPFNIPTLIGNEIASVTKAIQSNMHCGNGAFTEECINYMKTFYSFHEVFLTTSCTTAMEMGIILCDIKPGDEVILPSYTFSSTANSFVLRGGIPVFCEIDSSTMNIDPNKIEDLITDKTKLIMPIDYAGIPCEIERINDIAKKYKIRVLQDCAQSFHSFHKSGMPCGSAAPLAAFSFHETKNINCGEGGALIVNDPNLVERGKWVQEKGTDRSLVLKGIKNKYSWVDIGSSFILSDILAAMLCEQVKSANKVTQYRDIVTQSYKILLEPYESMGYLSTPKPPDGVKINNHAFFVIFDSEKNQKTFLTTLKANNINAYIGYVPLHSSPMGQTYGYKSKDLPLTEDISHRIVRLPLYTDLHVKENLDYCINGMKSALQSMYQL